MFGLLILSFTVLSGCASVPMAKPDSDLQAKKFNAVPGKSSLYIYRDEIIGSAIKIKITLNDKIVGETAPKTYFNIITDPGQQKFTCTGETTRNFVFDTKPDQLYFIRQEMKMGILVARCSLYTVPEQQGKMAVNACHMAQSKLSE